MDTSKENLEFDVACEYSRLSFTSRNEERNERRLYSQAKFDDEANNFYKGYDLGQFSYLTKKYAKRYFSWLIWMDFQPDWGGGG